MCTPREAICELVTKQVGKKMNFGHAPPVLAWITRFYPNRGGNHCQHHTLSSNPTPSVKRELIQGHLLSRNSMAGMARASQTTASHLIGETAL
jgi:hypothetical protein